METPTAGRPERKAGAVRRIDRLGYLLDNSIRIPGIGYRIGYDAIIGLIPGVGDLIGLGFSSYIVVEAARQGVPPATLLRMVVNVAVEALVGTIPLLGDLFDAVWKANARNVKLLHHHLGKNGGRRPASNRRYFSGIILALLAGLVLIGVAAFLLVRLLLGLLGVL